MHKNINRNNSNGFLEAISRQLTEEENASCYGKLTIYECETALRDMENNSPGSDEPAAEFYRFFTHKNKCLGGSLN